MRGKKQRQKHIPQRSCIVCRQKIDKRQLTRIVRTAENSIVVDASGKQNGRGAYVCQQQTCREKILTGSFLSQALRGPVSEADKTKLAEYFRKSQI